MKRIVSVCVCTLSAVRMRVEIKSSHVLQFTPWIHYCLMCRAEEKRKKSKTKSENVCEEKSERGETRREAHKKAAQRKKVAMCATETVLHFGWTSPKRTRERGGMAKKKWKRKNWWWWIGESTRTDAERSKIKKNTRIEAGLCLKIQAQTHTAQIVRRTPFRSRLHISMQRWAETYEGTEQRPNRTHNRISVADYNEQIISVLLLFRL